MIFWLSDQIRKSSVDIVSLIAEGSVESSDHEWATCAGSATGYATSLEYFALVTPDLELIGEGTYVDLNSTIIGLQKKLSVFWRELKNV